MLKKGVLTHVVLAALAWCAPPAAARTQAAAWTPYTYPGDEFSVELPAMPLVYNTVRQVNGDWRKHESGRVFDLYSDGVIYFVAAFDRPDRRESFDFFAAELNGAWRLVPKGESKLGGFEGVAYDVVGVQRGRIFYDVHGEARAFRTKAHAYLALALTTEPSRPEVGRFLDSLMLGAAPAGETIAAEALVPRYEEPKSPPREVAETAREPAEPYTTKEVGRKAVIVYKPEPPYTEEARKKGVTGFVRLRVVLSSKGQVTDYQVLKSLPNGLTESALRVARHMRFFPAEVDGRSVSQYVVLEYNFNIY